MNPVMLLIGFLPVVLFGLLDGRIAVGPAALIAAVVAVAAAVIMSRRAVPVLPIVQAATMAVIAALGYLSSDETRIVLTDYGQGIASLSLAAFILATVSFAPFTAIIARAGVPRARWNSPQFLALNRRISLAWGVAVVVLGVSRLLYGFVVNNAMGSTLAPRQLLLLKWGPAVVAIIIAVRYTQRAVAAAGTGGSGRVDSV